MQLRTVIRPALSSALVLCLLAGPAYAQEDDDAVEATQEELDAVGGLRGKEKAPTLESVDTAPTATETTSTDSSSSADDSLEDAPSAEHDDGPRVYFRLGLGFSAMKTPGFNTDFSVRDDSPSRSIYSFSADVPATDSQTHFSTGVNILWNIVDPVRVGLNLDVGYAPLTWDGAGIFAFSIGPSVEMDVADSIVVGAGLGIGILDYQIGFDVEAADVGDAYMTFDDTDIYFDESDQASMQVRKTGFLLAPEVNLAYQPDDGSIGVVMRVQYLDHYIDTEAPWELQFSENSGTNSSESSSESVEVSYEGDYVVDGSELPKVFDFSGLAYHLQVQFRF